jgi:hypothetical protein
MQVAFGPDVLHSARTFEDALARSIESAAKAGRWDARIGMNLAA